MRTLHLALFAALCASLAACDGGRPAAPAAPPAPPELLDGEYRGTSTRFQSDLRGCPHPGLVRLEVINNGFQFRWDGKTRVDARIAPDGAINGGSERITLVGRRTGNKLEGDVTNGECGLHFTVIKRH